MACNKRSAQQEKAPQAGAESCLHAAVLATRPLLGVPVITLVERWDGVRHFLPPFGEVAKAVIASKAVLPCLESTTRRDWV